MATPVVADLSFVGRSGKSYQISMYTADTAAFKNTFSSNTIAVAASTDYWRAPEDVTLTDMSITTGTTQKAIVFTQDGAVKNGTILGVVGHVSTSSGRPRLAITFPAGVLIGANTI